MSDDVTASVDPEAGSVEEPDAAADEATEASSAGEGDELFGTGPDPDADATDPMDGLSVEAVLEETLSDLEKVTTERDEYLDIARRVQAEFENYRKRTEAQRVELVARAAEGLAAELLPVLDACDAAIAHGAEDVAPIRAALESALEKQGLEKVDAADVPFDPNVHEAVLSEPGSGSDEPEVVEVMRAGYLWKGRVIRAAMVKVRD